MMGDANGEGFVDDNDLSLLLTNRTGAPAAARPAPVRGNTGKNNPRVDLRAYGGGESPDTTIAG